MQQDSGDRKQRGFSFTAQRARRQFGRVLKSLLAVGLLLASPGGPQFVFAQTQADEVSEALARFSELREGFASLRSGLDRTQFDLDALGLELAFEDAETIVTFVREEIAFEQYPGVLRGGEGTLVDGAGNALDQALLLAILLGDAGYQLQIARGELSVEQAGLLLQELQGGRRAPTQVIDPADAPLDLDDEALAQAAETIESELERLQQDTDGAAAFIHRELAAAGLELPGSDVNVVVEEARDYFWVEYRLHESDEWQAAHVAFSDPPASLAGLDALSHLDSSIPEELQHRFRFEVFIEQRLGGDLKVTPVMAAWERPVPNMTGIALTYANMPDSDFDGFDLDLEAALAEAEFFYPMLNGDQVDGALAFDLLGNTVDPMAAAAPAAGLFQSVGGLFGEAAGALAGEDDPADFVTLTAQWLEYTLIAPGGEETTHRRTVFDRIGAENRAAGRVELTDELSTVEVAAALATSHTFMVSAGRFSEAYVLDGNLASNLALLDYTATALADVSAGATSPAVPDSEGEKALRRIDHLNLFATMDDTRIPVADVASYRHAPGLVVISSNAVTSVVQTDVVSNARRSFRVRAGELPVAAPDQQLLAGVWESRVEGLAIASEQDAIVDTFSAFQAAEAEHLDVLTLTAADNAALEQLDLPLVSRQAMQADLEAGFIVITPAGRATSSPHVGWWRVHADSGETLGRGSDGRGSATEYAVVLTRAGLAVGGVYAFTGCAVTSNNPLHYACCIIQAGIVGAASFTVGAALAGAFAAGAVIAFVALDVTAGAIMLGFDVAGASLIPSLCERHAGNPEQRAGAAVCWLPG